MIKGKERIRKNRKRGRPRLSTKEWGQRLTDRHIAPHAVELVNKLLVLAESNNEGIRIAAIKELLGRVSPILKATEYIGGGNKMIGVVVLPESRIAELSTHTGTSPLQAVEGQIVDKPFTLIGDSPAHSNDVMQSDTDVGTSR